MFIEKEFCCKSTISDDVLLLKGKFNQLHLQKLIKNYINFFVVCKNCNNFNTVMEKSKKIRQMNLLKCLDCGSSHVVSSI